MLKENPTSKWLDQKISHYLEQNDKTMAEKFLMTYGPLIEGYDYAKKLEQINKKRITKPIRRGRR